MEDPLDSFDPARQLLRLSDTGVGVVPEDRTWRNSWFCRKVRALFSKDVYKLSSILGQLISRTNRDIPIHNPIDPELVKKVFSSIKSHFETKFKDSPEKINRLKQKMFLPHVHAYRDLDPNTPFGRELLPEESVTISSELHSKCKSLVMKLVVEGHFNRESSLDVVFDGTKSVKVWFDYESGKIHIAGLSSSNEPAIRIFTDVPIIVTSYNSIPSAVLERICDACLTKHSSLDNCS